ncbi:NAD(P)H-dependent glycerol-3-phosphate dehydrogenase [uncultured Methanobrevibacter sp.]|uniref:NAD(P)H-dependent glycerol-3-phosphate dehydrogenase n=1 Tax=uncultured Methanobrevibacter sp. TaxID=253161 RepID=UPI0025FEB53A|nr:NAD(P)H-dependent glycerol-3-phosphate dehydrogenase [uncultured Methanobrevibacter sp.]
MVKTYIIGAGALGTALAQNISKNLKEVYLYARRKEVSDDINNNSQNKDYFPNVPLNSNIIGINDLNELKNADCVILTIPSSSLEKIIKTIAPKIKSDCIIISTIKGINKKTSEPASEIIKKYCQNPLAVLSGPNIANEIVLDMPAASTIAINSNEYEDMILNIFQSDKFKVQFSDDLIGTELCGILKNILAISFGICEGLKINDSAKFAVLNKGFVEAREMIKEFGGKQSTILNYCGFGDMVTASTLPVSRNHTLGVLYGQKIIIDENATGVVFEGKNSIITVKRLCDEKNINSSIVEFVNDVIIKKDNPESAFKNLWQTI